MLLGRQFQDNFHLLHIFSNFTLQTKKVKNRFQIKSFITATFFLVAYLNVFATQASCNLPHFFEEINKSTSHQDNSHNHHHDNEGTSSHHHDEDSSHHEKDAEKDNNCCNDNTTAFFANQGNHVIFFVDFKNTFCVDLAFANTLMIYFSPEFDTKGVVSYSLPPPKIPDIRVFIRSFII